MRTIRTRIDFFSLTLVLVAAICATFSILSLNAYRADLATVVDSSRLQRDLMPLRSLSYDFNDVGEWHSWLKGLQEDAKKRKSFAWHESLLQLIHNAQDRALYENKKASVLTAHFLKAERELAISIGMQERKLTIETERASSIHFEMFLKWGAAAFLLPLFGFALITHYLKKSVFEPLRRLSDRMLDFLADRYSFKFSIPDNTEIGDLQATFNSLAQRVLNHLDDLKTLDRAKSDFLSIASHELRTPMTSIKGSLALLRNGVMGHIQDGAQRLVMIAEKETDRLIRLINDILDLAKLEARSFNLQKRWIPVDEILEKSLEGLLGLAESAHVKLHLQTLNSPIEIFVDEDRIQQIITNLVSNAIKFSGAQKTVAVYYSVSKGSDLSIQIKDEGDGISEEDQGHIFEKFSQATTKDSPLIKGTGLGLAIAKALVEEHGGMIGVTSSKGQGATFWISLVEWRTAVTPLVIEREEHHDLSISNG